MSTKYIPIDNDAMLYLTLLSRETGYDLNKLLNTALQCLDVYFEDEIVHTIVDDYYSNEDDE